MMNSQFSGGESRAQKIFHWSLLGAAPEQESRITRTFCKSVGNPALNVTVMVAIVCGGAVNMVTEKVADKRVFDLDLD